MLSEKYLITKKICFLNSSKVCVSAFGVCKMFVTPSTLLKHMHTAPCQPHEVRFGQVMQ